MSTTIVAPLTLDITQLQDTLERIRPSKMTPLVTLEHNAVGSWDLATALYDALMVVSPVTDEEEGKVLEAFGALQRYYAECRARGFRTTEQVWRDRLRAVLPFAQRDIDETAKLAENREDVDAAAKLHRVVEFVNTEVDRFEPETRGEKFDDLLARIVPLNQR